MAAGSNLKGGTVRTILRHSLSVRPASDGSAPSAEQKNFEIEIAVSGDGFYIIW